VRHTCAATGMSAAPLSAAWAWYVRTLVDYAPDGWVARAARTARVLAALLLAPFALLMLLVRAPPPRVWAARR
jgi:hypothetical protein